MAYDILGFKPVLYLHLMYYNNCIHFLLSLIMNLFRQVTSMGVTLVFLCRHLAFDCTLTQYSFIFNLPITKLAPANDIKMVSFFEKLFHHDEIHILEAV